MSDILSEKYIRLKILSRLALLIVVLSSFVLFTALISSSIPEKSTPSSPALSDANAIVIPKQEEEPVSARSGLPLRLIIPTINVDAPIKYVGLTSEGAMDVPEGPIDVAWFNLGPRPGENGGAVIAGHYGWKDNVSGVFDNLYKLRQGDKISVEDDQGVMTTFIVRETKIYGKDEEVPNVFSSNDGNPHLNLITCMGVWDDTEKTFSDRLIVFTDKE